MTAEISTVGLDIKEEQLRGLFEEIIASQQGFRLNTSEDLGPPHLMILEMDEDRHKTFALVASLRSAASAPEIFLTAPRTDPDVLLEALRAGVNEFIPQPIQRDELIQACHRFRERHHARRTQLATRGQIISVMGSRGGVGTTTVAVNLALSLLNISPKSSVALLDLNLHGGDAAFFLDMNPPHTLGDLARNIARLDTTFLMSLTFPLHDRG